jgi:hypothetical protein
MRVTPNRDVLCHVCVTPHRDVPPYACYTGQTLFQEAHLLRLYRDVRSWHDVLVPATLVDNVSGQNVLGGVASNEICPPPPTHTHHDSLFSGNKTTQFSQSKTATLISKTRRNAASRRALLDTQAVVTCALCVCVLLQTHFSGSHTFAHPKCAVEIEMFFTRKQSRPGAIVEPVTSVTFVLECVSPNPAMKRVSSQSFERNVCVGVSSL